MSLKQITSRPPRDLHPAKKIPPWPALTSKTNTHQNMPASQQDINDVFLSFPSTPQWGRSLTQLSPNPRLPLPSQSPASSQHTSTNKKQQALQSPTPTPEPTKCFKRVKFHRGPTPHGHPKAGDYEEKMQHLINKACHEFKVHLVAFDATPDPEKQACWVQEAWDSVAESYKLTDRIITIVTLSSLICLCMQLNSFVDLRPDSSCT